MPNHIQRGSFPLLFLSQRAEEYLSRHKGDIAVRIPARNSAKSETKKRTGRSLSAFGSIEMIAQG
jgi:hypothetical protein